MQTLDMFLRFPNIAKKFISVCGSPLPLTTKLINAAQSNISEDGIKKCLSNNMLRTRMGLARFFFRLTCTTEKALSILEENQNLEDHFIRDSRDYETSFSPHSYNLYMRMLMNFDLDLSVSIYNSQKIKNELLLVDITDDQFTPPTCISKVYDLLKEQNYNIRKKTFETTFGHESWILDGERFYEFIKNDLIN